jgi:hypothetical protein
MEDWVVLADMSLRWAGTLDELLPYDEMVEDGFYIEDLQAIAASLCYVAGTLYEEPRVKELAAMFGFICAGSGWVLLTTRPSLFPDASAGHKTHEMHTCYRY